MSIQKTIRRFAALLVALLASGAALPAPVQKQTVVVYAATDEKIVRALIDDFERLNPDLRVDYHDLDSADLHQRFLAESANGGRADVLWSSAMDLQVKLVNDGHAQRHTSPETAALPPWANWKNEAFGTSYEPIAIVYNRELLAPEQVPATHADLLKLLRSAPRRFRDRLLTYDPARSGLGFLLHSQDNLANPFLFWSLVRVMGGLGMQGSSTTGDMLDRIADGSAVLAYNALGSYAMARTARDPAIGVVLPKDYTLVMSRVIFIARNAPHPAAARRWVDHVLSLRGQALLARNRGLYAVRSDLPGGTSAGVDLRQLLGPAFRPIAIGPGLLTYQDQIKRKNFLQRWEALVTPRP